jgi:hypothetical protein
LAWYYYDKEKGIKNKIITKKYRMSDDYERVFLVYSQKIDPLGNPIVRDEINGRTLGKVITFFIIRQIYKHYRLLIITLYYIL